MVFSKCSYIISDIIFSLIIIYRDTVHKEMEKLSDDLSQAMKKLKILDADNKELQEEKRGLNYQLESLRREIASALHERDKVGQNFKIYIHRVVQQCV